MTIQKAYLLTNPTQFNDTLYCYTDKLNNNIPIIIHMCGEFKKKSSNKSKKLPTQKYSKIT